MGNMRFMRFTQLLLYLDLWLQYSKFIFLMVLYNIYCSPTDLKYLFSHFFLISMVFLVRLEKMLFVESVVVFIILNIFYSNARLFVYNHWTFASSTLSICQSMFFICFTTYGCCHPCLRHNKCYCLKSCLQLWIDTTNNILEGSFLFYSNFLKAKLFYN